VPGGGSSLLYISRSLQNLKGRNTDETVGINIVKKALLSPIKKIIKNAGLESSLIIEKLIEKGNFNITFDAQKNKIVDAFEEGIVDPTKVVKNALQSATSIASLLISTESTISKAEKLEKNISSEINNISTS
jgi:chaperonin GroEL